MLEAASRRTPHPPYGHPLRGERVPVGRVRGTLDVPKLSAATYQPVVHDGKSGRHRQREFIPNPGLEDSIPLGLKNRIVNVHENGTPGSLTLLAPSVSVAAALRCSKGSVHRASRIHGQPATRKH